MLGDAADLRAADVRNVLATLDVLTEPALFDATEGVSAWLYNWREEIGTADELLPIWKRIWNVAARGAADHGPDDDLVPLNASSPDRTPIGRLVSVFLACCPERPDTATFALGTATRGMRDHIDTTSGHARLIARRALFADLRYLFATDRVWTKLFLIEPLKKRGGESDAYWRELSRQTRYSADVLGLIGEGMAARVCDQTFDVGVRKRWMTAMVLDILFATKKGREPAISRLTMQQVLRNADDVIWAHAAVLLVRFVRDLSDGADDKELEAAELFRSAVGPFLRNTWPRERTTTSPVVVKSLVQLPRLSGDAFVEAVSSIERYLEPFSCYTIMAYGFIGSDAQDAALFIDDTAKAEALLKMLGRTVGQTDGAVVPRELSDLLAQIRRTAPPLEASPVFRRLATAARNNG